MNYLFSKLKTMSKNSKKKLSPGNIGGEAKQFLVWHGEKFVVAVIVVVALWLAMQGLGYQSLSWQPSELGQIAAEAEQGIRASTRTAGDEDLTFFDYAEHAEQIKKTIEVDLYSHPSEWNPPLEPQTPTQKNEKNETETPTESEASLSEPGESTESEPLQDEVQ